MRRNISEIELQIMWNRLLSVVEEQAQTLVQDRLQHLGARGRRHFRRCVRSGRPDAGTGGHWHARPHQHDGPLRRALSGSIPSRANEGRRRLRHQRPMEGHGASVRSCRRVTYIHGRTHRCAVRLHDAPGRYGRCRPDARRPPDLPRGPVHSAAASRARRRDERRPAGDDPLQRARAGAGHRRCLRADGLQRYRRPPSCSNDARIRTGRSGHVGRGNHQPQPPGHGGGHRRSCPKAPGPHRCASMVTRRRSISSAR